MNWLSKPGKSVVTSLRGWCVLPALLALAALLLAPVHHVSHQDDHGAHHCAVCSLAKGQVDAPEFAPSTPAFELVGFAGPVREPGIPVSPLIELLPPGRAPPVSVIPS